MLDELGRHRAEKRGVTLFELDPKTCTTRNRQTFDTYMTLPDRAQLLETMESAKAGTIIIGVTADTAENDEMAFQSIASSFFAKYNMDLTGLGFRDKFAFIMQKGYPKKTIFQRKPAHEQSLQMRISIRGKLYCRCNNS